MSDVPTTVVETTRGAAIVMRWRWRWSLAWAINPHEKQ